MRQTLIRLSLALMLSGAFPACAADAVTNISPTLPSTDAAGNPLLETNRAVDAQRVGLIGHSRLCKTVL